MVKCNKCGKDVDLSQCYKHYDINGIEQLHCWFCGAIICSSGKVISRQKSNLIQRAKQEKKGDLKIFFWLGYVLVFIGVICFVNGLAFLLPGLISLIIGFIFIKIGYKDNKVSLMKKSMRQLEKREAMESYYKSRNMLPPGYIKCPYCGQPFNPPHRFSGKIATEKTTSTTGNIARGVVFLPWGVVSAIKNKEYIKCPHCKMKIMQG